MKIEDLKGINVFYSARNEQDLTAIQAILLSLFCQIDIKYSIPSNAKLSKLLAVTKPAISKSLAEMIKKGYLEKSDTLSNAEAFFKLTGSANFKNGCLFCGYDKCTLDEHHYPLRAKDGGTETILICPNCHRRFHELVDYNRKLILTKKSLELLK